MAHNFPICDRYIFYDNSNIFIEAKKFYAKQTGLRSEEDPRSRIDLGYLHDQLKKVYDRKVWAGLYGSEPPPLDTVWAAVRRQSVVVKPHTRDFKNKERQLDPHISLDIGFAAGYASRGSESPCFTLVAGDQDYIPTVELLIDCKFRTTVVSWKSALFSEYERLAKKHSNHLTIQLLDDMLSAHKGLYLERQWRIPRHCAPGNIGLQPELSMIAPEFPLLKYGDKCWTEFANRDNLDQVVDKIVGVFKLPFVYHIHDCFNPKRTLGAGCDTVCSHTGDCVKVQFAMLPGTLRGIKRRSNETDDEYQERRRECEAKDFREKFNDNNRSLQLIADEFHISGFEDAVTHFNQPSADQSYVEGRVVDEFESIDESDMSGNLDAHHEPYQVVTRKRICLPTVNCQWDYRCKSGDKCKLKHTPDEMRFFNGNPNGDRGTVAFSAHPNGFASYKATPCKMFAQGKCYLSKKEKDVAMCPYAHGVADARCYCCRAKGQHWTDECPSKLP